MKKIVVSICILLPAVSAWAYYGNNMSGRSEMTGMSIFMLIVMLGYIVLSIVVLVRWWNMTTHIKEIKEHLTYSNSNPKITYLIAIGEVEKANKSALVMIVDKLMPIYYDQYNSKKVESMNQYLSSVLPKMEKLGIQLPDYAKTGEKFIDYMNNLTGRKTAYVESQNSQFMDN